MPDDAAPDAARALLRGLDDAQADAVTTEASPLAVIAAAGSGKTTVLTRRIAHRVLTGSATPRHVLALTFTRDAAGEIRWGVGTDPNTTTASLRAVLGAYERRAREITPVLGD